MQFKSNFKSILIQFFPILVEEERYRRVKKNAELEVNSKNILKNLSKTLMLRNLYVALLKRKIVCRYGKRSWKSWSSRGEKALLGV